jgi:mTERF domain-containing protein
MNRIIFTLSLLGVALGVNGFISGCGQRMHPNVPVPSLWMQADQDMLTSRVDTNNIYPKDTLLSIRANSSYTLAPDIAYFYLQNTLGLSEEAMWRVTLDSESILGMTPRNLEKKVSLLRRTMNLSDEDVRVILGKQPTLLHYSADRNLAPTILFLVRALDLSKSELRAMVMDCPSILSYSLENLRKKIAFFTALSDDTGGIDSTRELLVGTPKLLQSAVDTALVPKLTFLTNEINFSLEELRLLVKKNPKLLLYSLDENLREKIVFFFILQLHMQPEEVRRILLAYPQIMDYNLENHMKPIAEYFMTELQFSAAEVGTITLKFPRLFSYSLFKIKHVIGYLRYELELDPRQAKRVVFQAPQVLGLGESSLKEKLSFLKIRLNLTVDELGLVLSKMPTLVCLAVETSLVPKLEYLENSLLAEHPTANHSLKEIILKQPTVLGYSLNGRLRPRMEQLMEAGISPSKITVGISMPEDRFQLWLSSSQSKRLTASLTPLESLRQVLNFTDDHLDLIDSVISSVSWTVPSLESWIQYLKAEIGVSTDELKNTILSYPHLLDSSSRPKLKYRLRMLRSIGSVLAHLNTIAWSDSEFDTWILQQQVVAKSRITYLRRMLGLSDTECRTLLLQMPLLESAQVNKVFQQKLDYISTHISNSGEVKHLVIEHPFLLDLSVKTTLEPRMQTIRLIGISDPTEITSLMKMSDGEFLSATTLPVLRSQFSDTVEHIQSMLELSQNETDSLLYSLSGSFAVNSNVKEALDKLVNVTNGDVALMKAIVFQQPQLLLLSSDDFEKRMENRKSSLTTREGLFSIVTMTDEGYQELQSLRILRHLNLTDSEIDVILAASRRKGRLGENATDTLAGKLEYFLSLASEEDVKQTLVYHPKLLSYPFEKFLHVTSLVHKRTELQARLNMTESEMDLLLPMNTWLVNRSLQTRIEPLIQYLIFHLDGAIDDLKRILLDEPKLITLSISKTIQPRMDLLQTYGCPPNDIGKLGVLSQKEAEEYVVRCYFTRLGFSPEQANQLIGPLGNSQLSSGHVRWKLDYLLHNTFRDSQIKMKDAIMRDPSILKQSLEKIQLRTEVALNLESIGFESVASDIDGFFSRPDSMVTRELCPVETWCPSVKVESSSNDHAYELETLNYFPPPPTFTSADDENRESARVVYWR